MTLLRRFMRWLGFYPGDTPASEMRQVAWPAAPYRVEPDGPPEPHPEGPRGPRGTLGDIVGAYQRLQEPTRAAPPRTPRPPAEGNWVWMPDHRGQWMPDYPEGDAYGE